MSSVPCNSSIRFLYGSFSFIDVDTLLAVAVDCLLPHHGGASIQSRAYSNSSDEIESGLTFRSKQSAVWSADPFSSGVPYAYHLPSDTPSIRQNQDAFSIFA